MAQINRTEIVFVVDDTESMGLWFEAVADVYDEITELVMKDPLREVLIGITYYNDNEDGMNPNPVVVNPLVDVRELGRAVAEKVRKHEEYKGGGLPREMVFAGLTKAVKESGWSQAATRKLLIHIGDFGDHSDKEEEAKKVAAAFVEQSKYSPIEFYSIQVIDPEKTPNKKDSRAFRTQVKTILKALKQDESHYCCLKLSDGDKVPAPRQMRQLRELVRTRYDETARQALAWKYELEKAQRSNWENTKIDAGLRRILIDNGVDLEGAAAARRLPGFPGGLRLAGVAPAAGRHLPDSRSHPRQRQGPAGPDRHPGRIDLAGREPAPGRGRGGPADRNARGRQQLNRGRPAAGSVQEQGHHGPGPSRQGDRAEGASGPLEHQAQGPQRRSVRRRKSCTGWPTKRSCWRTSSHTRSTAMRTRSAGWAGPRGNTGIVCCRART